MCLGSCSSLYSEQPFLTSFLFSDRPAHRDVENKTTVSELKIRLCHFPRTTLREKRGHLSTAWRGPLPLPHLLHKANCRFPLRRRHHSSNCPAIDRGAVVRDDKPQRLFVKKASSLFSKGVTEVVQGGGET